MKKVAKIALIITTIVMCVMAYNRVSSSQQADIQQIQEMTVCRSNIDSARYTFHYNCIGKTNGSLVSKKCKE
mgnify:CR=1 FL=1